MKTKLDRNYCRAKQKKQKNKTKINFLQLLNNIFIVNNMQFDVLIFNLSFLTLFLLQILFFTFEILVF